MLEDQQLSEIVELHPGRGVTRLVLECQHQHGLVYIVDGAENNWVCSNRRRPAHSLSGFFKELTELHDARIREILNRWGIYYRPLPLAQQEEGDSDDSTA